MVTTIERLVNTNGNTMAGGRAAIYVRVSNTRQEDGASLDVQLETCQKYCDAGGLDVVARFQDVESGLAPSTTRRSTWPRAGALTSL